MTDDYRHDWFGTAQHAAFEANVERIRAERAKPKLCKKKLGEPDEANGMQVCNAPVHFTGSDQAKQEGTYSGWYHDDPALDLSHHALWDGAL